MSVLVNRATGRARMCISADMFFMRTIRNPSDYFFTYTVCVGYAKAIFSFSNATLLPSRLIMAENVFDRAIGYVMVL